MKTTFGVVRYWRTYMREVAPAGRGCRGFHPTDIRLGLTKDRLSFQLLDVAVRLAGKLSFSDARSTLGWFVPSPPSTEVIEKAVLGFGSFAQEFVSQAPPPSEDGADGEVLVIMVDGKGVPTATARELERRRGERPERKECSSRRHRGRGKRYHYPARKRRKKGDKSKNARMATQVVMYTLRRDGERLVGPLNVWRYASLAPKRHGFETAQREAAKRGFAPLDAKTIQIVIDGDPDLARYAVEYFPHALVTIDVMHVLEYIHDAGKTFHKEGSDELAEWSALQRELLYSGELDDVLGELRTRKEAIPKTGPGNKKRRERIEDALGYISKRRAHLNYDDLIEQDLEIATGMVEGAVKHVIAKRFDHGGMRWIRERAEALLQLRCIDINGQWEQFMDFVHDSTRQQAIRTGTPRRLLQNEPGPLPHLLKDAA